MKYILLATVASLALLSHRVEAATDTTTGTLMQINGVDVSGTTENIWYFSRGHYTLLTSLSVNTTVSYGPYAYSAVFYLPHNIPETSIVVTNQAATIQAGFSVQQVTPVGTVEIGSQPTTSGQTGNVGGSLLNISATDVSGTTEYIWSYVNGTYYLLGSTSVNTSAIVDPFAYNALVYLPVGIPLSSIVVTNQAAAIQRGFVLQLANPLGTASAAGVSIASKSTTRAVQTAGQPGRVMRAYGQDVSGTTEYVWNHVGTTYVLLGASPVNATDPRSQYSYNALFFLPTGLFYRNIVVTNQAGTIQHGAVIDGKLPVIVPSGG